MTESEARMQWCPMVRAYLGDAGVNMNANFQRLEGARCQGSACMMWRWLGKYKATRAGPMRTGNSEHGFCGLAGKP